MDRNGDDMVVNCGQVGSIVTEVECRDNELAYMYYHNFGAVSGDDLTGEQGLFQNIQNYYWSSTFRGPFGSEHDFWTFDFAGGGQTIAGSLNGSLGFIAPWAVRDGDVITAVPSPSSLTLLLAGMSGLFIGKTNVLSIFSPNH